MTDYARTAAPRQDPRARSVDLLTIGAALLALLLGGASWARLGAAAGRSAYLERRVEVLEGRFSWTDEALARERTDNVRTLEAARAMGIVKGAAGHE